MATIVVGVEDSLRSQDAVALAGELARATGADVLAVCAFAYDDRPAAHYNPVVREPMREAAEETLDRLCEPLSDVAHVERLAVADPAPARALLDAAANADASLIVVGSSHAGYHGRLCPGSTAWRLLHGATVPVALAPQGHRMRPHNAAGRITAAFDGSPGARAAVSAAEVLAQAAGRPLRVVRVFAPELPTPPGLVAPPGPVRVMPSASDEARAELDAAVTDAEAVLLTGDPASELARESEVAELLVLGSRGYGPAGTVALGDVSSRLVQSAACPALIVPTGVREPLAGVCGKLRTGSTA